jgi:hypothetical protein
MHGVKEHDLELRSGILPSGRFQATALTGWRMPTESGSMSNSVNIRKYLTQLCHSIVAPCEENVSLAGPADRVRNGRLVPGPIALASDLAKVNDICG